MLHIYSFCSLHTLEWTHDLCCRPFGQLSQFACPLCSAYEFVTRFLLWLKEKPREKLRDHERSRVSRPNRRHVWQLSKQNTRKQPTKTQNVLRFCHHTRMDEPKYRSHTKCLLALYCTVNPLPIEFVTMCATKECQKRTLTPLTSSISYFPPPHISYLHSMKFNIQHLNVY